jgi:hypothetical protein
MAVLQGKVLLSTSALKDLLLHPNGTVRLAGLSILASSLSTTRPIAAEGLKHLQRALPLLFSEEDAGSRGHILSLISNLVIRLLSVTNHYKNLILKTKWTLQGSDGMKPLPSFKTDIDGAESISIHQAKAIISGHLGFIYTLLDQCTHELQPESGYQRHIFSLEILRIVIESRSEFIFDERVVKDQSGFDISYLTRLLSDLTMNAFEDMRRLSATLLGRIFMLVESSMTITNRKIFGEKLVTAVERAEHAMLESGRADHADGYGRLFALSANICFEEENPSVQFCSQKRLSKMAQLLDKAEAAVAVARANTNAAISSQPLHGTLLALRYIVKRAY